MHERVGFISTYHRLVREWNNLELEDKEYYMICLQDFIDENDISVEELELVRFHLYWTNIGEYRSKPRFTFSLPPYINYKGTTQHDPRKWVKKNG